MQIIIDYKLDNWNDTIGHSRGNKRYANIVKQREMGIVKKFLIGIPKITKYPIQIDCEWHVVNANSDLDNKSLKAVLDAMQEVGILENDNCKHINKITYNYIKDTKDYLVMNIEGEEC